MVIRVGINGFGRLGRVIFRTCLENPEIQLSAINDPAIDIDYICYLIKFDSTHGKFKGTVTYNNDEITINDRHIKVFREKLPSRIPWQAVGVQYVVEASGMFTCIEKASGHLESEGVKRVILTAPSIDVPMIILGVNDHTFTTEQRVLSCASSTLYCLAPIIKILQDNFGVTEGFITSIHAMTPSLKPLDGLCLRGKHWRDHRSIHQNIIPATTGACKALGKIIPQVKDKLTGLAFRVPIVNVSVLDLTVRLTVKTSLQEIIKSVEKASNSYLQNIVKLSNEEAVSSDFIGDNHSCIMDVDSSLQLKPNFYKIICWYENEYSYACRVLDVIFYSEKQFSQLPTSPKMMYVVTVVKGKREIAKEQDKSEQTEIQNYIKTNLIQNQNMDISQTISSSSQDKSFNIKTVSRPIGSRKPMSSQTSSATATTVTNRGGKRRNEIFKVWNDVTDLPHNTIRHNRASFFHSCMTFSPKASRKTDCTDTQERLEDVKKEFCKLVNITEDLLKKSCNNKMKLESSHRPCKEIQLASKTGSKESQEETRNSSTSLVNLTNSPILNVCGDYQSGVLYKPDNYHTKANLQYCNACDKTEYNSNYNIAVEIKRLEKHVPPNKALKKSKERNCLTEEILNINTADKRNKLTDLDNETKIHKSISYLNINTEFKEKVAQSVQALITGLTLQAQKQSKCIAIKQPKKNPILTIPSAKECLENDKVKCKTLEIDGAQAEKKSRDTQTIKIKLPEDPQDKNNLKDFKTYIRNKNYKMQVIDDELKKRNIILINNTKKDTTSDSTFKTCSIDSELLTVEIESCRNSKANKRVLESLSSNSRETTSIKHHQNDTPENTVTTISNRYVTRTKQDLFDKLDSTSASDSNNSFEINEKKSQILQIGDLSSSVEDLTRLDKICRIIEISDELSDKLFSALDTSDIIVTEQKKWSFKDLCEKIQLDEFCNKVFGKTM